MKESILHMIGAVSCGDVSNALSPTPGPGTTTSLPGGTVSQPYSETLQATGGMGSLVWSRTGGSLPANLTLSPAGVISGTPTNIGTANFTVRVTDALSQSDTQALSITVTTTLTIASTAITSCRVNRTNCNRLLVASGGTAPIHGASRRGQKRFQLVYH